MLRGDDAEYQRRYHTLGSNTRRLSNPDMEAFAKLHKSGDMEHQRNKYPPQHAATLVNTNCARQQVTRDYLCVCIWYICSKYVEPWRLYGRCRFESGPFCLHTVRINVPKMLFYIYALCLKIEKAFDEYFSACHSFCSCLLFCLSYFLPPLIISFFLLLLFAVFLL